MYFGADYYPEHWPRERWKRDAELMQEAGINVVRLAEFAWALLEPQEGQYDLAWLDEAIELLGSHGIDVIMCTPTATPPAWLCAQYPEIMRVNRDGKRVAFGQRRQYCATSATYRRLCARIINKLAEHYSNNPHVIGWQLDNEFGGGNSTRCYCPECQRAFQQWAERRYGTLEALNDAWGTNFWSHRYTSWAQIPLPWSNVGVSNPCLELDFWRFASDQMVSFQQEQIDILREHCPKHFITTNLMGFHFQDINYYDLARNLDVIAWDNYPLHAARRRPDLGSWSPALSNALMRGLLDRPFWVMEQQAGPSGWDTMSRAPKPGALRQMAYQAISHGADAIVFFRWRTCRFNTEEYWHGILDHDGQPRRRYHEIAAMGQEIRRLGDTLEGGRTPKQVAILFSYDDAWALRLQPGAPGLDYSDIVASYYRILHQLGLSIDVIPPDRDLTPYPLVIAPVLHVLPEAWADNLNRYVSRGGMLIVGARSGVKDMSNRIVNLPLPGLLRDVLGIEVDEYDPLGSDVQVQIRFVEGPTALGHTWADVLSPIDSDCQILATFASEYYAGRPAITRHRYGQGQAVYVGTIGSDDLLSQLLTWAIEQVNIQPLMTLPSDVELAVREKDGRQFLFITNYGQDSQTVEPPYPCHDLLTGQLCEGRLSIEPQQVLILTATN